jgi:hypothetical protein
MKSSARLLGALLFVSIVLEFMGFVPAAISIYKGENLQDPSAIGFMLSGSIGLLAGLSLTSLHKRVSELESKCADVVERTYGSCAGLGLEEPPDLPIKQHD